jgi:hypothetical protein
MVSRQKLASVICRPVYFWLWCHGVKFLAHRAKVIEATPPGTYTIMIGHDHAKPFYTREPSRVQTQPRCNGPMSLNARVFHTACRELVELAQELIEAGSMTEKRAERINQSIENLTGVPITYPLIEVTTQSDQPPSNEEFLHVHEDGTASLHDHPQHYGDEPHDPEMKPLHLQLGILADRIAHLAPNESELAADASWSKTPLGRISCELQALADNQREVVTNG